MQSIDVAIRSCNTTGERARSEPFAIFLVLEGNRDMETIPPLKRKVQQVKSKKFCGATPLVKSTIRGIIKLPKFRLSLCKSSEITADEAVADLKAPSLNEA
jgi:hypothetical protein